LLFGWLLGLWCAALHVHADDADASASHGVADVA
jgi:hypothetical protein